MTPKNVWNPHTKKWIPANEAHKIEEAEKQNKPDDIQYELLKEQRKQTEELKKIKSMITWLLVIILLPLILLVLGVFGGVGALL